MKAEYELNVNPMMNILLDKVAENQLATQLRIGLKEEIFTKDEVNQLIAELEKHILSKRTNGKDIVAYADMFSEVADDMEDETPEACIELYEGFKDKVFHQLVDITEISHLIQCCMLALEDYTRMADELSPSPGLKRIA